MSGGIYQNKGIIKAHLMKQFKAYRNLSVKVCLMFWIVTLVISFTLKALESDHMSFVVEKSLMDSFILSLIAAAVGYCVGAMIGGFLQKRRLDLIAREKERKKLALEEQISIRQARLDLLQEMR